MVSIKGLTWKIDHYLSLSLFLLDPFQNYYKNYLDAGREQAKTPAKIAEGVLPRSLRSYIPKILYFSYFVIVAELPQPSSTKLAAINKLSAPRSRFYVTEVS